MQLTYSTKDIMADSPAIQTPIDPQEQPILDSLLRIRDSLQLLKEDKTTYVKSQDVISLYEQVIEQVTLLNAIRDEHGKPLEQNRGPLSILQMGILGRKPSMGPRLTYSFSGQGLGRLFSTYLAVFPYHRTQQ